MYNLCINKETKFFTHDTRNKRVVVSGEARQMKEVSIYKGKNWFEKVEKINGEYVFFEVEEENGETPNIRYSLSELCKQVKEYKENGYRVKIYNC